MILNWLFPLLFAVILVLGEEIGFRGYLLPHLQSLGSTRALLLSGFLHGCWHLPLMVFTPFYHGLGNRWIVIPLFLLTLTMAGVCYGYLRLRSGSIWPAALLHAAFNTVWGQFSALTVAVGSPLILEYLAGESGVLTLLGTAALGLPYGVYHYSDALGAKLGHVPYAIPFAWYSMLYLSYVMARLITGDSQPDSRPTWGSLLWRAFVSGMVITAWDVLVDPMAAAPGVHSWVWEQGGAYYGVPNSNFVGWVLTGFTVILLYSLFELRFPARPLGKWTGAVLVLPLVVYGLTMLQLMLRNDAPSEWPVLAAFVMGFPLVAAVSQLRKAA